MPIPHSIHNLCDLLDRAANNHPRKIALKDRDDNGYSHWNYSELANLSYSFARLLKEKNVHNNSIVGLLIPNSKWWGLAFFAAIACDATVVPIDTRLSAEESNAIIKAAGINLLISTDIFDEKNKLLNVKEIIEIDISAAGHNFLKKISAYKSAPLTRNNLRIHNALIIFTSGTTGSPKGVPLTHGNLLIDIFDMLDVLEISEKESFVSILPLNHVFEITGGFLSPIALNAMVTYTRSLRPDIIFKVIQESEMTIMMVVPSFLKLFLSKIKKKAAKNAGNKFYKLLNLSLFLTKFNIPTGKFIFPKIKNALSSNFKGFICGGAPLDVDVVKELHALGITVLQGYGLTETSPVVAVNTLKYNRHGSVGKKLPNAEFKINPKNGELLVRGGMVFNGYFNDKIQTENVFYKDWFKTGDLAKIDKHGFLYIVGRVKSIIVTAGGKNIYPEYVETFIKKCEDVSEACVIGVSDKSGAEKPVAVISIKSNSDKSENEIKNEIKAILEQIAEYQRPKNYIFMDNLPMTSSHKVKREKLKQLINKNYNT